MRYSLHPIHCYQICSYAYFFHNI